MKKILGLINARGGSKTVKNKNIKSLCGHPLIAWTITTALKCKLLSDVVVSTDSLKIAKISKSYGAKVPFMRPNYLAGDNSKQFDTIYYVLNKFKSQGNNYDAVALLQPTFPLRKVSDIVKSINLMKNEKADTVISVNKINPNLPYTLYNLNNSYTTKPLFNIPKKGTNRQNLSNIYARVGCIYLIKTNTILKNKSIYGKTIKSILIPDSRSFDIDTKFDWSLLEAWIKTTKLDKKYFS